MTLLDIECVSGASLISSKQLSPFENNIQMYSPPLKEACILHVHLTNLRPCQRVYLLMPCSSLGGNFRLCGIETFQEKISGINMGTKLGISRQVFIRCLKFKGGHHLGPKGQLLNYFYSIQVCQSDAFVTMRMYRLSFS